MFQDVGAISLWDIVLATLSETVKIILMVAVLMIIIEFLELRFRDKIREKITNSPVSQIVGAALVGAVPGCIDAFLVVSLYVHGLVGFGALTAVMLSTAGDEAFVMLALIPEVALPIFSICAVLGIAGGFIADKVSKSIDLKTCQKCAIEVHEEESSLKHFLRVHAYKHVLKEHVPKLFLWIFLTMLAVDVLMRNFDLEPLISGSPEIALIVFAALIGIVPESGPHLIFTILFKRGLIPFSVLLTNTLSQDGHGLLPLLSHSVKDSVYVQIFTTLFSLGVGIALFLMGM